LLLGSPIHQSLIGCSFVLALKEHLFYREKTDIKNVITIQFQEKHKRVRENELTDWGSQGELFSNVSLC
jgi:hypothetical protein